MNINSRLGREFIGMERYNAAFVKNWREQTTRQSPLAGRSAQKDRLSPHRRPTIARGKPAGC